MSDKLESINWDKIDKEKADFILNEAEKAMINVSENNKILDTKSEHLRNFYMAILSGIFVIYSIFNDKIFNKSHYILSVIGIGVAFSLIVLLWSYKTKKFPIMGTSPQELLKEKYNEYDITYLINSQLQTYSTRIKEAKIINNKKGFLINTSIVSVAATFLVALSVIFWGNWWGRILACF
tara:strand:- start:10 stop:549 length:540 start_codon:yes stop_codon:yes gene_type:complete